MTGRERVANVLAGESADRLPILPIVHTGLAPLSAVSLGRFHGEADSMARVTVDGYQRFGYDGVQLSLGVVGEAEALGAAMEYPSDAAPVLREHLLADLANLDRLRQRDPTTGGRMPLFSPQQRRWRGKSVMRRSSLPRCEDLCWPARSCAARNRS